jgi:hypothetical protein
VVELLASGEEPGMGLAKPRCRVTGRGERDGLSTAVSANEQDDLAVVLDPHQGVIIDVHFGRCSPASKALEEAVEERV